MLSSAPLRSYLSPSILSPEVLAFSVALASAIVTGTTLLQQAIVPALTGYTGYRSFLIAFPLFLVAMHGLVFPYYLVRDRPQGRLVCLGLLFLAVVASYMSFTYSWWQTLREHLEVGSLTTPSLLGAEPRDTPISQVLFVLLQPLLLGAYMECLLWNSYLPRQHSGFSAWAGGES